MKQQLKCEWIKKRTTDNMKKKIIKTIKNFLKILNQPEMQVLPGQLAYNMLISFVPILAICATIISNFISNFNLTNIINDYLPNSLAQIIIPLITTNENTSILIVILGYIFMATKAPKSIIISSNSLYKIKEDNNLKINLKAIFMTIILIILLIFMIFIPILGSIIIKLIQKYFEISKYIGILKVIKILTSFIFVYISIKLLYTMAPSKEVKSSTTTIGAIFTSISWIIATEIFSFYITNLARYNELYGNFANLIILLLWVYLLAYLFVVGMAMNINVYNSLPKEEVKE
ncbi:MAG: YihY/virulence factor BrkB family protein [bacterium]|nr:YihY/virulence factor BrkB family protein [bacterium]